MTPHPVKAMAVVMDLLLGTVEPGASQAGQERAQAM